MSEFGKFNDRLDNFLPGDNATLGEWLIFVKEAYDGQDREILLWHLDTLSNKFGKLSTVEFSTIEFFKYLNAIAAGYSHDNDKLEFYRDQE